MSILNIINTILLSILTFWYINLSIEALADKKRPKGLWFYVAISIYIPTAILILAAITNFINLKSIA